MKIKWTNAVIGVGAGVVDEVMEAMDNKASSTNPNRLLPFKGWTDWSRVALAVVGYGGQLFNFYPSFMDPLAQSEITLVTKSVGNWIRSKGQGYVAPNQLTRVTHRLSESTGGKMMWRPKGVGVS